MNNREAFEAWLKSELENTLDQDGKDYILSNKELCRHVWQAAIASQTQQPVYQWIKGYPTNSHYEEWFIARTIHKDRIVLRRLPEDYSYDFTTADGTYCKKEIIKEWMQFPDSAYLPF